MNRPTVDIEGTALECLDPFEALFLQEDVADYFGHGVVLEPGAVVLDVGANIGVFTAEVSRRLGGDARILAFEPMPPVFEVLKRNAEGPIAAEVDVFPFGLGSKEATLEFSFFPLMSCLSSAHRGASNIGEETQRVAASLTQMIKSGRAMPHLAMLPPPMLDAFIDSYVKTRLKFETHPVLVRPLSAVLDELALEAIDLLKIDVEGAEEDVLAGIEARHWPQIRQVVLELERVEVRRARVVASLEAKGFSVEVVQDQAQRIGDYGLVYALRG